MSDQYEYTFRKGSVRSPETWRVSDDRLSEPGGHTVPLSSVSGGTFIMLDQGNRKAGTATLTLDHPNGTVSVTCNSARGHNRSQFLRLTLHVLAILETVCPSATFTVKRTDAWAMRAFALLGLAFALGGGNFIFTGLTDDSNFAIGMGAAFVAMGVFVAWASWPRSVKPLSPTEQREAIERQIHVTGGLTSD